MTIDVKNAMETTEKVNLANKFSRKGIHNRIDVMVELKDQLQTMVDTQYGDWPEGVEVMYLEIIHKMDKVITREQSRYLYGR